MLQEKCIGKITGKFFVARYQRGYRWGQDEVERLLKDISESEGQPYRLQPIVVKRRGETEWELVDGQQRLTTLFLVYRFMQRAGLKSVGPQYSITYETRLGCEGFLESLDPTRAAENIDFFHLHAAYETIRFWFGEDPHARQVLADKFFMWLAERVSVIWYEAPTKEDAVTLFTRLNIGRIPLTDGELIKALLLSQLSARQTSTERSIQVAAQWDGIERDLSRPEIWAFISQMRSEDYPTRITLLLDTLADLDSTATGTKRSRFHTFEVLRGQIETGPDTFWDRVLDLHDLIMGWFEDLSLFHKIGFLIASRQSFGSIFALSQNKLKSDFEESLVRRIREEVVKIGPDELLTLSYENKGKCQQLLLLMNIETVLQKKHSNERFPFHIYHAGRWSLEHIHAQNARNLTNEEQQRTWLIDHRIALSGLPDDNFGRREVVIARIDAALEGQISRPVFDSLAQEVTSLLSLPDGPGEARTMGYGLHDISNLALLDSTSNSALGNALFEVKRRRIMELDRAGRYIPPSTRQVFLKYFTGADAQQPHFWSMKDREAYLEALLSVLDPYLKQEAAAS